MSNLNELMLEMDVMTIAEEMKKNWRYKHGCSYMKMYATWNGMLRRCLNPKNPAYKNYGMRKTNTQYRDKQWLVYQQNNGQT